MTNSGTVATAGLLLVNRRIWSCPLNSDSGILTMPLEPLAVSIGSSVRESGGGDGVSSSCHLAVASPACAVIVTIVTVETGLVSIENASPPAPPGMVIDAGTVAAGDELDRLTRNPPGGASPSQNPAKQPISRSTIPSMWAPPVALTGNSWNGVSFSFGGTMVIVVDADVPLYVAVTVTVVGVVTKPTRMPLSELGNPVGATSTLADESPAVMNVETRQLGQQARMAGGQRDGRAPAGAAPVISTEPRASPPLNLGDGKVTAPIRSGVARTVNDPVADQAV